MSAVSHFQNCAVRRLPGLLGLLCAASFRLFSYLGQRCRLPSGEERYSQLDMLYSVEFEANRPYRLPHMTAARLRRAFLPQHYHTRRSSTL